jgi:hypothetical protein
LIQPKAILNALVKYPEPISSVILVHGYLIARQSKILSMPAIAQIRWLAFDLLTEYYQS